MRKKRVRSIFLTSRVLSGCAKWNITRFVTPPNYAPTIRLISAEAWLLDKRGQHKALSQKEMDELLQTFGDKIEKLADDEYAEELDADRDKEWQAKLEYEEYQRSQYNDGLREEQMLGRV